MAVRGAFARTTAVLALSVASVACFVDVSEGSSGGSGGHVSTNDGPAATAPGPAATRAPPATVVVDTGKTMGVEAGEGVGVFVEYGAGGLWRVSWTCDTRRSGNACAFSLKVSSPSPLENPQTDGFLPGDVVTQTSDLALVATTTTTANVNRLTFQGAPGATLEIEATVSGYRDGGFLFFVQDGKVNGGYQGSLTNPIRFRGSSP